MSGSNQALGDRGRHLLQEYRATGGSVGDFVDDRSFTAANHDESVASSVMSSIHGFTPEVSFYDKRPNGGHLSFRFENGSAIYYCDGEPRPEFRVAQVIFQKNLIHVVFPDIQKSVVIPPSEAPELIPKLLDIFEAAGVQHNLKQKELLKLFLKTDKLLRAANQLYAKANHQCAALEVEVNKLQKAFSGSQADVSSTTGLHRESSVDVQRAQSLEQDNNRLTSRNNTLQLEIDDLERQLRILQSPDSDNSVNQMLAFEQKSKEREEQFEIETKKLHTQIAELEAKVTHSDFMVTKLELELSSRQNDLPAENEKLRDELRQAHEAINTLRQNTITAESMKSEGATGRELHDLQTQLLDSQKEASTLRAKLTISETELLKATSGSAPSSADLEHDLQKAREEIEKLTIDSEKMIFLNAKYTDLLEQSEKQAEDLFKAREMAILFKEQLDNQNQGTEPTNNYETSQVVNVLEGEACEMIGLHEERLSFETELLNEITSLDTECTGKQQLIVELTAYCNNLQYQLQSTSHATSIISILESQLDESVQLQQEQLQFANDLLATQSEVSPGELITTLETQLQEALQLHKDQKETTDQLLQAQSNRTGVAEALILSLEDDLKSAVELEGQQSALINELLATIEQLTNDASHENVEIASRTVATLERELQFVRHNWETSNYLIQELEQQADEGCALAGDTNATLSEHLALADEVNNNNIPPFMINDFDSTLDATFQLLSEQSFLLDDQRCVVDSQLETITQLENQLADAFNASQQTASLNQILTNQVHSCQSVISSLEHELDQSTALLSQYHEEQVGLVFAVGEAEQILIGKDGRINELSSFIKYLETESVEAIDLCGQQCAELQQVNNMLATVDNSSSNNEGSASTEMVRALESQVVEFVDVAAGWKDLCHQNALLVTDSQSQYNLATGIIGHLEMQLKESIDLFENSSSLVESLLHTNNESSSFLASLEEQLRAALQQCEDQRQVIASHQQNAFGNQTHFATIINEFENQSLAYESMTRHQQSLIGDQQHGIDVLLSEETTPSNIITTLHTQSALITSLESQLDDALTLLSDKDHLIKEQQQSTDKVMADTCMQSAIISLETQLEDCLELLSNKNNLIEEHQTINNLALEQPADGPNKEAVNDIITSLETQLSECFEIMKSKSDLIEEQQVINEAAMEQLAASENRSSAAITSLESQLEECLTLLKNNADLIEEYKHITVLFDTLEPPPAAGGGDPFETIRSLETQLEDCLELLANKNDLIEEHQTINELALEQSADDPNKEAVGEVIASLEAQLGECLEILNSKTDLIEEQQTINETAFEQPEDNNSEKMLSAISSLETQLVECLELLKNNSELIEECQNINELALEQPTPPSSAVSGSLSKEASLKVISSLESQLQEALDLISDHFTIIKEQQLVIKKVVDEPDHSNTVDDRESMTLIIKELEDQVQQALTLSEEKEGTIGMLCELLNNYGDAPLEVSTNTTESAIVAQLENQVESFCSLSADKEDLINELLSVMGIDSSGTPDDVVKALEDQLHEFEKISKEKASLIESQQQQINSLIKTESCNSDNNNNNIDGGHLEIIRSLEEQLESFVALSEDKQQFIEEQLSEPVTIATSESDAIIKQLEQQLDAFVELSEEKAAFIATVTSDVTNTTEVVTNKQTTDVIKCLEDQLDQFIALSNDKTELITQQQEQQEQQPADTNDQNPIEDAKDKKANLIIELESQINDFLTLGSERSDLISELLTTNNEPPVSSIETTETGNQELKEELEQLREAYSKLKKDSKDDDSWGSGDGDAAGQLSETNQQLLRENESLKEQLEQTREAYSRLKKDSPDDDEDSWGSGDEPTKGEDNTKQLSDENQSLKEQIEQLREAYSRLKKDSPDDDDDDDDNPTPENDSQTELVQLRFENERLQQDLDALRVAYSQVKTDTLEEDEDENEDEDSWGSSAEGKTAIEHLEDENKKLHQETAHNSNIITTLEDTLSEAVLLIEEQGTLQKQSSTAVDHLLEVSLPPATSETTPVSTQLFEQVIKDLESQLDDSCDLNAQLLSLLQSCSSTPQITEIISSLEKQADDACNLCDDILKESKIERFSDDTSSGSSSYSTSSSSSSSSSPSGTTSPLSHPANVTVPNSSNQTDRKDVIIKELEIQLDDCLKLLEERSQYDADNISTFATFLLSETASGGSQTGTAFVQIIEQLEQQLDESMPLHSESEAVINCQNEIISLLQQPVDVPSNQSPLVASIDESLSDTLLLLSEQQQLTTDCQEVINNLEDEISSLREKLRLSSKKIDDLEMVRSDEADEATEERENLQARIEEMSLKLKTLQTENANLKELSTSSPPAEASNETSELRTRVEQLEQIIEGLARQDTLSLNSHTSDAVDSNDITVIRKALIESRNREEELESDLESKTALLEDADRRVEEAEEETNDNQRLINELEGRVTQLTRELADEIAEKTKITTELDAMKMATTKTLSGLPEIENEMADLTQSRDAGNNPVMSAMITRIEAVVTELKLELSSAREEAAKHKGEAEVLRSREVEYMLERKEVNVLQTRLSAAETQRDTATSSLERAQAERDDALQMYSDQLKKASNLESSLIEMQDPSQSAAAVWETTEKALRDKISSLETECDLLQRNVTTAEGSRNDSLRLADECKQKHSEIASKLKAASIDLRSREKELETMTTEIETLRDTVRKQSQQIELFENDQRLETNQLESTQNELSEIIPLTNQVKELTEKLTAASRERSDAVEKKLDDEEEIRSLRRKVEALEQELSEIRHHNAVLKDEIVGYQSNVTTLTDELSFHRKLATNIDPSSPPSVIKSKNTEYNLKLKVSQLEEELRRARHGDDASGDCIQLADSESSVLAESVGKTLRASAEVVELCASVKKKAKTQPADIKKELTRIATAAEGLVRSLTRKMQSAEPYLVSFTSHLRGMNHVDNIHKDPVCMNLLQHHRDHWCSGAEAAFEVLHSAQDQLSSLLDLEGSIDSSFTSGLLAQIKDARADSDSLWKPYSMSHDRMPRGAAPIDPHLRSRRASSLTSAH